MTRRGCKLYNFLENTKSLKISGNFLIFSNLEQPKKRLCDIFLDTLTFLKSHEQERISGSKEEVSFGLHQVV